MFSPSFTPVARLNEGKQNLAHSLHPPAASHRRLSISCRLSALGVTAPRAQVIFWNSFRPLISFIRFLSSFPLAVLLQSHTQLWRLIRTPHTDVDAGDLSELSPRSDLSCEKIHPEVRLLRTGDVERVRRGALSHDILANSQVIRPRHWY